MSFPTRYLKPAPVQFATSWTVGLSLLLLISSQASWSESLSGSKHTDGLQTATIVAVQNILKEELSIG